MINVLYVVLGFLGLIAVASMVISVIVLPFALYKGFKKDDWKLGKTIAIVFASGFALQFVVLVALAAISGLAT